MRGLVDVAAIPFMANQRRGEAVLRVNRKFRTHGPEEERAKYHMRPAVEAAENGGRPDKALSPTFFNT
jgi:hypothetical protein